MTYQHLAKITNTTVAQVKQVTYNIIGPYARRHTHKVTAQEIAEITEALLKLSKEGNDTNDIK